ncbi:MAG: exodeoxyribonuclease VII large subunit [Ruminococcaceae bacterium]|nr:exodeoxyribonuclease VII large subunit [Oscillospiraceae bacterium]
MKGHIFSIREITEYIKEKFQLDPLLNTVYVRGEISNYKFHSSGHHYMTLKDSESVMRAVMFKFDAVKLKFRPESGMKIIAKGRISVFPRDGQYQLYITDMTPDGIGALSAAFEQLKAKLLAEGLFSSEHKRQLPKYPKRIALVTSPTGAAIRDILRILKARYPLAEILVVPVLVQGPDAAPDIANAIRLVNEQTCCDLIITGRGGGSLEDLWAFNDEDLARVIFDSKVPVISAVGHEPDVTISDFVADLRASTPSNAAELAVPDQAALYDLLMKTQQRLTQMVQHKVHVLQERVKQYSEKPALKSPLNPIAERRLLIDYHTNRLANAMQKINADAKAKFVHLAAGLDAMSPIKVLTRGYSIASNASGKPLTSASQVSVGERLNVQFHEGSAVCTVEQVKERG